MVCAVPVLFDSIAVIPNPTLKSNKQFSIVSLVILCWGSSITTCPIVDGIANDEETFAKMQQEKAELQSSLLNARETNDYDRGYDHGQLFAITEIHNFFLAKTQDRSPGGGKVALTLESYFGERDFTKKCGFCIKAKDVD